MFAHVSPEEDSFGETVSTLKFAQRVSTVELGASHSNKESSEVMRLKEQVNIYIKIGIACCGYDVTLNHYVEMSKHSYC